MKIQLLAAAALAVFTACPGAVTASVSLLLVIMMCCVVYSLLTMPTFLSPRHITYLTHQQSLRGAIADSEDLDLALEYADDYPKVDVYSDYDFDPEEEDADLDLDLYGEDGEDGEDMDLISYNNRRTSASNRNRRFNRMVRNGNYKRANRLGDRIDRARQWRGRNSYRNFRRFGGRNFDHRRNFRRNFNGNGISRQACRE